MPEAGAGGPGRGKDERSQWEWQGTENPWGDSGTEKSGRVVQLRACPSEQVNSSKLYSCLRIFIIKPQALKAPQSTCIVASTHHTCTLVKNELKDV